MNGSKQSCVRGVTMDKKEEVALCVNVGLWQQGMSCKMGRGKHQAPDTRCNARTHKLQWLQQNKAGW